jgi:hypothetical protein
MTLAPSGLGAGAVARPKRLGRAGSVLLVSCYELGHQPFSIASPWATLGAQGFGVEGVDASLDALDDAAIGRAELVAVSVPMLTALRLGMGVARRVRAVHPQAHIVLFGLYASLNAAHLLDAIADSTIGGEFEQALVDLAWAIDAKTEPLVVDGVTTRASIASLGVVSAPVLQRLPFVVPRRDALPKLDRYAKLIGPAQGERRVAGYVEASRGCLHTCKHCPITPIYGGRFFVVARDVVLADAEQQIEAGARHLTFGDPDFLNGVRHSLEIVRALHSAHPDLTFDATIKVEHILKHRERFAELARLGCLFIFCAFESLSDRVLSELAKGHTRADIVEALAILEDAGIALRPSFVAFTPWTTLDDFIELCDFILDRDLIDNVDPIQLAIRLLLPPGSALLDNASPPPAWLGELVAEELGYRWTHPDPRMDALFVEVTRVVDQATATGEDAAQTLLRIRSAAYASAGRKAPERATLSARRFVPKLTEGWFCCAEPSLAQQRKVDEPRGGGSCCGSS